MLADPVTLEDSALDADEVPTGAVRDVSRMREVTVEVRVAVEEDSVRVEVKVAVVALE